VSPTAYAELLRTADVAVQLRLISNGEASAAVADCLSAGLPTILTDIGWLGELPADAVSPVPLGVSAAALAERMLELVTDGARWSAMSENARVHAAGASFSDAADAYLEALEL
jgi:glycosyltransferase involved in cell wall biosynthesis